MNVIRRGVISVCVFVLCLPNPGQPAFERQRIPPLPWIGGSLDLPEAYANNPARLASPHEFLFASGYSRMFSQRSLQTGYVYSALPMSFGSLGFGAEFFGNRNYMESQYMAGIARRWNENGSYGLLIRLFSLDIRNYGQARAFTIDVGTSWQIAESLHWGLGYGNLTQATIGKSEEALPQQIFSSVEYQPVHQLTTRLAVIHSLRYPARYNAGFCYAPFTWIEFAAGVSTEPTQIQFGTTITWNLINVQYTVTTHSVLPFTHWFGLVFDF